MAEPILIGSRVRRGSFEVNGHRYPPGPTGWLEWGVCLDAPGYWHEQGYYVWPIPEERQQQLKVVFEDGASYESGPAGIEDFVKQLEVVK